MNKGIILIPMGDILTHIANKLKKLKVYQPLSC